VAVRDFLNATESSRHALIANYLYAYKHLKRGRDSFVYYHREATSQMTFAAYLFGLKLLLYDKKDPSGCCRLRGWSGLRSANGSFIE